MNLLLLISQPEHQRRTARRLPVEYLLVLELYNTADWPHLLKNACLFGVWNWILKWNGLFGKTKPTNILKLFSEIPFERAPGKARECARVFEITLRSCAFSSNIYVETFWFAVLSPLGSRAVAHRISAMSCFVGYIGAAQYCSSINLRFHWCLRKYNFRALWIALNSLQSKNLQLKKKRCHCTPMQHREILIIIVRLLWSIITSAFPVHGFSHAQPKCCYEQFGQHSPPLTGGIISKVYHQEPINVKPPPLTTVSTEIIGIPVNRITRSSRPTSTNESTKLHGHSDKVSGLFDFSLL